MDRATLLFPAPKLLAGLDWCVSHAALPIYFKSHDGHRVYFSARDEKGRARIGYLRFEPSDGRVLSVHPRAVIDLGGLGTFDDSGVTGSCIVRDGERLLLYYTGWQLGVTVPFYLAAGLAVSRDGGDTFERASTAPLLERSAVDPYLTASPYVLRDGARWRMWYVSGSGWRDEAGGPRHNYHIRYGTSKDGLRWQRNGVVAIDYAHPSEHAFSRPSVVRDRDRYRMWYAFRGDAYRLGYAYSFDGEEWRRDDEAVAVTPSGDAWDSEMMAYPDVFDADGGRYMLYNGNDYGRTGIGLVRLSDV